MATDIDPNKETRGLENDKFAINFNNKVIVRVEDEAAIEVLKAILIELGGVGGVPNFSQVETVTTGSLQTLISDTVPVSKTRSLSKVVVTCRQPGRFTLKINSLIVASGRIGSSELNKEFKFFPQREALSGDIIKLEFEQLSGPNSDIEAYIMATDT